MEDTARKQGVRRWSDCTPEHILHLARIKKTIPNALIVHIIRDGRDVALSSEKQHYVKRAFWDKNPTTMVAGLYWEWMVKKGRDAGRKLGNDYMEVRFEDLVSDPRATLARVGAFIDHDLDYDRIKEVGIGSVSDSEYIVQERQGRRLRSGWDVGSKACRLSNSRCWKAWWAVRCRNWVTILRQVREIRCSSRVCVKPICAILT